MVYTRHAVAAVVAVIFMAIQATPARGAIVPGQVDTFEDGTLHGWFNGGLTSPNPASNVLTGGPDGADDNYMRVTSNGQGGAGGKLVVYNIQQWAGDYSAAGVNAIEMQVNNTGPNDLVLRLIFLSAGQTATTLTPVNLPSGSGWQTVSFPLDAANLSGGGESVLENVSELNLVHAPAVITARSSSPDIVGVLGVDDITAIVPEPGTAALALAGAALAMRRAAPRQRCAGP